MMNIVSKPGKLFRHDWLPAQPTLERIDGGPHRVYRTPDGNIYPSATSVLSVMDHSELDAWVERVGEEAARLEGARAAKRGTAVHSLAEAFLKNEPAETNPIYLMDFDPLRKVLQDRVDDVRALELQLYSDKIAVAGTVDCIASFDGVPSLIDFKTSKRDKHKDEILGYFLQTTMYCMMVYERTGVVLRDIVIVMAVDGGQSIVFKEKPENYMRQVLTIRKLFRERNKL